MEQTVYIDIYFLINFSMDLLCFFLAARLLSQPLSAKRAVIAGAIGGAYACAALLLPIGQVYSLLADLAVGVLICGIASSKGSGLGRVLEYSVVYCAVSVVLGGAMTALYSFFNRLGLDALMGGESESDGISVWLFALLALISGGAALFGGRFFKKKSSRHRGEVEITVEGIRVRLTALCDSGNLLCEPISKKPCVIVDKGEAAKMLPPDLAVLILEGRAEGLSQKQMSRIRIISAETVGGGAMLYAVRPDKIQINMGGGWSEADAYVAFGSIGDNAEGAKALVSASVAFGVS